MWERLSKRSRRALFTANQFAKVHGLEAIDTDLVLLGVLAQDDPDLAEVLGAVGVDVDRLRSGLEQLTRARADLKADFQVAGAGIREIDRPRRRVPSKRGALALRLVGHAFRSGDQEAVAVLEQFGLTEDQVRQAADALEMLPEPAPDPAASWQLHAFEGRRVWRRMTEHGRHTLYAATECATTFGNRCVDTEHLLWGVCSLRESVALKMLGLMKLDVSQVKAELKERAGTGEHTGGELPRLAPRGERVLDWAFEEARQLNDSHIGTEHLLLGLLHEEAGLAAQVRHERGASLEVAYKAAKALRVG
jgi:ATP-dependent Clp protease ATP-binding subunit ClpA